MDGKLHQIGPKGIRIIAKIASPAHHIEGEVAQPKDGVLDNIALGGVQRFPGHWYRPIPGS